METYLSIPEASQLTSLSVQVLNELVIDGRIKSIMTSTGNVLISSTDLHERLLIKKDQRERFSHLAGKMISLSEAARKYHMQHSTLSRWTSKGYITRLGTSGRQTLVDESEVAMYSEIYHLKNGSQGKWIFDRDGLLYQKKR